MAKYLNFEDMINGGGPGKSGSRFEGGGPISDLGNLLFTPLGSRDANYQHQMAPMQHQNAPIVKGRVSAPVSRRETPTTRPEPKPEPRVEKSVPKEAQIFIPPYKNPVDQGLKFDYKLTQSMRDASIGSRIAALSGLLPINPVRDDRVGPTIENATPMTFTEFTDGLGNLRFTESPDQLMQAYRDFLARY